jgi:hypothetical protein
MSAVTGIKEEGDFSQGQQIVELLRVGSLKAQSLGRAI